MRSRCGPLQLDPQPKVTKLPGRFAWYDLPGCDYPRGDSVRNLLFRQKEAEYGGCGLEPTAVKTAPTKDVDETIEAWRRGRTVPSSGLAGPRVSTDGSAISPDDPAASLDLPPAAVVQGAHRVGTGSVSGNNGSSQMTPKEKRRGMLTRQRSGHGNRVWRRAGQFTRTAQFKQQRPIADGASRYSG